MCNSCRPRAGAVHRLTGCNGNGIPLGASSQQWQSFELPRNQNRALTAIQTQTCHHHTQKQSQSLSHMFSPSYNNVNYDENTSCQPYNSICSCSDQHQYDCNSEQTFEILLHDLLDYAIRNFDTSQDCNTCRISTLQPLQQPCNICATDQQQLVSLLLNLIERSNTTTTQTHAHCHRNSNRTQPQYCSNSYSTPTTLMSANQYQRTRCTCRTQCGTCTTVHEQTKTLFDVLFRMTRRRSSNRCQHSNIQIFNRNRPCTHIRTSHVTNDTDLCRLIRQILQEIESEGDTFCTCQMTGCQEYVGGNVRRLKKVVREIERSCGDCDGGDVGCRCGVESYEMSRTTTTYDEPERRRPRVGNFHVGWVL